MSKKTKKCKDCGQRKNILEFRKNSKTKDGYVSICQSCLNNKVNTTRLNKDYENFYIYRFLDRDNNIIYVGKTNNIHKRIYGHINIANSLGKTDNQFLLYPNVWTIEYSKVESDYHMNIYEIHYICKYNPPFNDSYKTENKKLFDLPELKWDVYIFKSYIDDVQSWNVMKNGKNAIDVKKELSNIDYYNDFINNYLISRHTNKKFNQELYMSDEYQIREGLDDDYLDFCKNDCEKEECDDCNNKETWRDIYNTKIKESKLKLKGGIA